MWIRDFGFQVASKEEVKRYINWPPKKTFGTIDVPLNLFFGGHLKAEVSNPHNNYFVNG
jgi:hypothetical protein